MQNLSALHVHGVASTLVLPWRHVEVVMCLQSEARRSCPKGAPRAPARGPLWKNAGFSGETWPGAQVPETGQADWRCPLPFRCVSGKWCSPNSADGNSSKCFRFC